LPIDWVKSVFSSIVATGMPLTNRFRPATTNNPDTLAAYAKMRVRVMRQVHYSVKHPKRPLRKREQRLTRRISVELILRDSFADRLGEVGLQLDRRHWDISWCRTPRCG
jgi:hypothetical protein